MELNSQDKTLIPNLTARANILSKKLTTRDEEIAKLYAEKEKMKTNQSVQTSALRNSICRIGDHVDSSLAQEVDVQSKKIAEIRHNMDSFMVS